MTLTHASEAPQTEEIWGDANEADRVSRNEWMSVDNSALLHKNANMRTSIDFPDPLFRSLKASAAMQGTSLRDHVLQLIERGMQQPAIPIKRMPRPVSEPPMLGPEYELSVHPDRLRGGGAQQLLDELDLEAYLNVVKYGSSSGETRPL